MDIADRLHKEAMNVPIEIGALMQDAADQLMRLHVQLEIAYDRLRVAGYKIDGPTLSGIDAVLTPNAGVTGAEPQAERPR